MTPRADRVAILRQHDGEPQHSGGRGRPRHASPKGRSDGSREAVVVAHPALLQAKAVDKRDRRRLRALLALICLIAASEGFRLVQLQAVYSDRYRELARAQRLRVKSLTTPRGDLLDRNGKALAISMPAVTVVANPSAIADKEEVARRLAPVIGVPQSEILGKLSGDTKFAYVARRLDDSLRPEIERLNLEGITVVEETRRFYPSGTLASSVLGYVGTDNQGLDGLEIGIEKLVAGEPGTFEVEQDPRGRPIPQAEYLFIPPVPGSDVMLTIDSEIQYKAEQLLAQAVETYKAKGGSILVMEVGTGEILAMANSPTFDPNEFWKASAESRRNRLVADVFEPGSTNKVVTAAAALEENKVSLEERIGVPNRYAIADAVFKDAEDHPPLSWTVRDIVVHSSNIGTIKIAQRLGPEKLDQYMRAFGYGQPTGLPLPGEAPGILLPPEKWWATSIGTVPIGQGIAVTGVQLAQVYATIANGGVRVPPKLVKGVVRDHSSVRIEEPEPDKSRAPRRVISSATASVLAEILAGVVAEGTGKRAAVPGYQVAGKTGTARKPSETGGYLDKYVASFVGFAPVTEPRFVVAVILDEPTPYYGGLSAAPVFSQMMGFVLSYENVPPKGDQKAFAKGSPSNSLQDSVVAGTGNGGSKASSAQKGLTAQGSGRT